MRSTWPVSSSLRNATAPGYTQCFGRRASQPAGKWPPLDISVSSMSLTTCAKAFQCRVPTQGQAGEGSSTYACASRAGARPAAKSQQQHFHFKADDINPSCHASRAARRQNSSSAHCTRSRARLERNAGGPVRALGGERGVCALALGRHMRGGLALQRALQVVVDELVDCVVVPAAQRVLGFQGFINPNTRFQRLQPTPSATTHQGHPSLPSTLPYPALPCISGSRQHLCFVFACPEEAHMLHAPTQGLDTVGSNAMHAHLHAAHFRGVVSSHAGCLSCAPAVVNEGREACEISAGGGAQRAKRSALAKRRVE